MKKKIVLYVLLAIVIIISGILFVHYNKVQNVFDEIYYTWDKESLFVRTKFKNVKAFENERIEGYIYPGDCEVTNILKVSYNEEDLENNASVSLCIYPDNRNFQVLCAISYEDSLEQLFMIFTYDVKNKTMSTGPLKAMSDTFAEQYPDKYDYYTYYDDPEYIEMFMAEHDITKEEIEAYRDYFLQDVLIGMWVDGNDEESRYSRSDTGYFVYKDELFANFE